MRVIDVTQSERAYGALRFARAGASAAVAFWLFVSVIVVAFALAIPLMPKAWWDTEGEYNASDGPVVALALIVLAPVTVWIVLYLSIVIGRLHRRVAGWASFVWLTLSALLMMLAMPVLIPAIVGIDLAYGGPNAAILSTVGLASVLSVLNIIVLWLTAKAAFDVARADNWSFAAARGFLPTVFKPFSAVRSGMGMPFYMAVGRQPGRWLASIKFGIHNVLAAAFALGLINIVRSAASFGEDTEGGTERLWAPMLAELSPSDAIWINDTEIFASFLERGAGMAIAIALFVLAAAISVPLAYWFGRSARKQLTRTYSEERAADGRPPVLFLRSFADDQVKLPLRRRSLLNRLVLRFGEARTLDEILLEVGAAYGPVCAIGKPGEAVPPFGAARQYLEEDVWRSEVSRLAKEAAAIVIVVDSTAGVRWEIDRIRELGLIGKTLFLLSPRLQGGERQDALEQLGVTALPHFRDDETPLALGAGPDSAPAVYVASEVTRDGVLVALTRFFLEQFGYPVDALARPKLDPERLETRHAQAKRKRGVWGLAASAAGGAALLAGGAFLALQWPSARQGLETLGVEFRSASIARQEAEAQEARETAGESQPAPSRTVEINVDAILADISSQGMERLTIGRSDFAQRSYVCFAPGRNAEGQIVCHGFNKFEFTEDDRGSMLGAFALNQSEHYVHRMDFLVVEGMACYPPQDFWVEGNISVEMKTRIHGLVQEGLFSAGRAACDVFVSDPATQQSHLWTYYSDGAAMTRSRTRITLVAEQPLVGR